MKRLREEGTGTSVDMSANEVMKLRLAVAMKECIETTPFDAITVKQICEKSGTSRQTFYRHFLDKYDLTNWYFDRLLMESFDRMGEGRTVYDGLVRKFTFIAEERAFFTAAFHNDDQNNLRDHDFHMIYHFYLKRIALWQHYENSSVQRPFAAVDTWTGRVAAERGLRSVSDDEDAVDEETRELLEMYCNASIYMTVQWVLGGMKKSPEELARLMVAAMPERINRIFKAVGLLE